MKLSEISLWQLLSPYLEKKNVIRFLIKKQHMFLTVMLLPRLCSTTLHHWTNNFLNLSTAVGPRWENQRSCGSGMFVYEFATFTSMARSYAPNCSVCYLVPYNGEFDWVYIFGNWFNCNQWAYM